MPQGTLNHTHTIGFNDTDETDSCIHCGEARPMPCSWGEQCATFQAEWAEWDIEFVGGLVD